MRIGSSNDMAGLTRFDEAQTQAGALGAESHSQLRARLENADVETVAREFESLFASMLVKEMRSTLGEGLFGEGPGADTYSGWFDQHVGQAIAETRALDLAGLLRAGLPQAKPEATEGER